MGKFMKKIRDSYCASSVLPIVLIFVTACDKFSNSTISENTAKPNNSALEAKTPTGTVPERENPKIEKADFKMTAEEYSKEFTREGVTRKDLEKYANKHIAVTGSVRMFSFEEYGTAPPYVVLGTHGLEYGVACYFGNTNLDERKHIRMDKIVPVQGFENEFFVPGVSPALDRCVVLEAD